MGTAESPNRFEIFRHVDDFERHPAGDVIFAQGEVAEVAYVVRSGEVAIVLDGREVERLAEGAMFGEMAIIESEARSATATAVTDVELAVIDRRSFRRLVGETPFFAENVMRVMAGRLRRAVAASPRGRREAPDRRRRRGSLVNGEGGIRTLESG